MRIAISQKSDSIWRANLESVDYGAVLTLYSKLDIVNEWMRLQSKVPHRILPTSCAKAVARKETGVHVNFHTRIMQKIFVRVLAGSEGLITACDLSIFVHSDKGIRSVDEKHFRTRKLERS